jgi:hypothetical protein
MTLIEPVADEVAGAVFECVVGVMLELVVVAGGGRPLEVLVVARVDTEPPQPAANNAPRRSAMPLTFAG